MRKDFKRKDVRGYSTWMYACIYLTGQQSVSVMHSVPAEINNVAQACLHRSISLSRDLYIQWQCKEECAGQDSEN